MPPATPKPSATKATPIDARSAPSTRLEAPSKRNARQTGQQGFSEGRHKCDGNGAAKPDDRGAVIRPNQEFNDDAQRGNDDPGHEANEPAPDERAPHAPQWRQSVPARRRPDSSRECRSAAAAAMAPRARRTAPAPRTGRHSRRAPACGPWPTGTRKDVRLARKVEGAKHHGVAGNDARPRGTGIGCQRAEGSRPPFAPPALSELDARRRPRGLTAPQALVRLSVAVMRANPERLTSSGPDTYLAVDVRRPGMRSGRKTSA